MSQDGGGCEMQQQQQCAHQDKEKGEGRAAFCAPGDTGGGLPMLPGEELASLTHEEMDRVARKLEEFARLHPDRVVGAAAGSDDDRQT